MTDSRGTSFFPTGTNRSKPSGTFTRAKRSSPVSGSTASTASESESPEMYGNGWPGPTASGVSTGKISRSKYASSLRISLSEQSSIVAISIPAAASAGRRSRRQSRAWRALRASTRSRIATSAWLAVIPSTERTPRSASSSSSRPATRDHEELVEVLGEDRGELDALEERERMVLGDLEDAAVVLERRQLPVEEAARRLLGADHHGLMVRPQASRSAPSASTTSDWKWAMSFSDSGIRNPDGSPPLAIPR